MSVRVMHRLAVELCTMRGWLLAARGRGAVITFAVVEMMIDVSVKIRRPVIPWPGADEYPA